MQVALALAFGLSATQTRAETTDPDPLKTASESSATLSSSEAATLENVLGTLVRRIVRKVETDDDGDVHIEVVGGGRGEAGSEELVAIMVPVAFFATILGSITLVLMFRTRSERIRHETVRLALDKGQDVPTELLLPHGKRRSDLRRGLVLASGGVGLGIMLAVMGSSGSRSWAVGLFPFMVGLGYLAAWWIERSQPWQDRR